MLLSSSISWRLLFLLACMPLSALEDIKEVSLAIEVSPFLGKILGLEEVPMSTETLEEASAAN